MAPRFGFDDGSNSDFDATLVLATMLASQLNEGNVTDHPPGASVPHAPDTQGNGSQSERARSDIRPAVSDHPSDNTKIWSDLSGSAARSSDGNRGRQFQMGNPSSSTHNDMQMPDMINSSKALPARDEVPDIQQPMETDHRDEPQVGVEINNNPYSQHHPRNWVGEGDDEDEDDDEGELYVQSTPQYHD